MSVEARELTSEAWTRWQGQVVNGVFPLGRYLGSSDHSGVFLTLCAARYSAEVAIKLVPANRALTESLLPRWKRAASLTHPHLLRLLERGGCQLEGQPFLYLVMEYADQTLAQLLPQRALTEQEAREMLVPILEALAFLRVRNLIHGQLKPANILVVGDQLKLASDTIRLAAESVPSTQTPSVYDPPEARLGSSSSAGDIWALGVCLHEALTRRKPAGCGESGNAGALPGDFSPAFRDVVARCLSRRPELRPSVSELMACATGQSAVLAPPAATTEATAPPRPPPSKVQEAAPSETATPEHVSRPPTPTAATAQPPNARALFVVILALIIVGIGWMGLHVLNPGRTPAAPARVPASAPQAGHVPGPNAALSASTPGRGGAAASPFALHEVIPEVPPSARRTIRGHLKVWVRVIIDSDGTVFAAEPDRAGPSRYFERLAIDAAKKWTFSPSSTPSQRLAQIRFEFTRDGTTGRAIPLH
jgi:TonB family protein